MASTGEYTLTLFQHAAQIVGYALVQALRKLSTNNETLSAGIHKTQGVSLIEIPLLAVIHSRPEFKTAMAEWMTSSVVFKRSVHTLLAYIRQHPSLPDARAFYASEFAAADGSGSSKLLDETCGTFDELYVRDRVKSPYFAALFPDSDPKLENIIRLPIIASLTDPLLMGVNARKAIFAAVHGLLVAKFVFDIIPDYHGVLPTTFDDSKKGITLRDLVFDADAHVLALIGSNLVSEFLPVKALAQANRNDEESEISGDVAVKSISQDPNRQAVTPVGITPANVSVPQLEGESLKSFRKAAESVNKLQAFLHLFRQRPMPDKEPLQYYQLQLIIAIAQYKNQFNPMSVEDLATYIDKSVPEGSRNPISILKRSKNIVVVVIQSAVPAPAPEGDVVITQVAARGPSPSEIFSAIPKEDENDENYKNAKEVLTGKVDWKFLKDLADKGLLDLSTDAGQRDAALAISDPDQVITWVEVLAAIDAMPQISLLKKKIAKLEQDLKNAPKK